MAEFLITTPPGKGAIAVVTLFAPQALEMIASFFVPKSGKMLTSFEPGSVVYGTIFEEDALVCPISEGEAEVHCHGSRAAVERICGYFLKLGAKEISVEAWAKERFHDKTENQKRAFLAMLGAETDRIAKILWDQFQGACERDERLGLETNRWSDVARHLTQPWKVALVGKPNVGKSSIFNRILGFPRAIVFEQAGTTRDLLREKTVIQGWSVELVDTAGLHETSDSIEREGIRRVREEILKSDLILWVREAPSRFMKCNETLDLPSGKRVLKVWNKADLLASGDGAVKAEDDEAKAEDDEVFVSALTETGIEPLLAKICRTLVPEEPPAGAGMRLLDDDE